MALTATATKTLQRQIAYILGMYLPKVIAVPPCKNNIMYSVTSHTSLKSTFDCADIEFLKSDLGDSFLVPPDAPDQSKFRLVDMYTSITDEEVKSQIVVSFSDERATLRLVRATSAYGMGVDCPNVREIIYYGVPSDTETYNKKLGELVEMASPH